MPFSDLNVVSLHLVMPIVESLDESSRIHLLSNLVSFVPPRFPSLSTEDVSAYLQLFTALLNSLLISTLDPSAAAPQRASHTSEGDDSDSEAFAHVLAFRSSSCIGPSHVEASKHSLRAVVHIIVTWSHENILSIQFHLITFLLALNAVEEGPSDQRCRDICMRAQEG